MKRISALLVLFTTVSAYGGEWHVGETLMCQDCHLQHSSEGGQTLPGGPFSVLLLKNSINEQCLSCHDGADPNAPDIQDPVYMYQGTSAGESAAGWFAVIGLDNHAGHNIGVPSVTPLQSQATLVDLNCSLCHAVHGNGNYRNLRYDPAGRGDSIVVTDGTDLFSLSKPAHPPTASATVTAYSQDNVAYRQNYSAWCASCHDQVTANAGGLTPAHFNGHPSDVPLNAFPGELHTDPTHWSAGIGDGFPIVGAGSGINRVPFEAPQATTFAGAAQPSASNEVVCVSCHKPHGSRHEKSMRWPYVEGGDAFLAGCQQCHNK